MIPKTFHDVQHQDRRYIEDYWCWLKEQPQDAWLLWARWANWDNADGIFELMIDRADCDLALVSWIFWGCDPAFYVRNPASYSSRSLIGKIIGNCGRAFYSSRNLHYSRYEKAIAAHAYVEALQAQTARPPFHLPRDLCGPFDGRHASIPSRYDEDTEAALHDIFAGIDGGLPRSEAEHWQNLEDGGDLAIRDRLVLPSVPADPLNAYSHLCDAAYTSAIFGTPQDARPAKRNRWRLFGP